jgi:hypothetical protein
MLCPGTGTPAIASDETIKSGMMVTGTAAVLLVLKFSGTTPAASATARM